MASELVVASLKAKALLLLRYGLAGSMTSLVYIVVYNLALIAYVYFTEEKSATSATRFLSSNLAYGCALLVQYSAHGKFTFGHREKRKGQLLRYLIAVGFGFIMAALFSAANTKLYVLPEYIVSIIVMVLVAISNFFFFTFWVYSGGKKGE
jgi:putative flippase GtrA